ncbi:ABC transporter permease [Cryobacterium sp. SO2]|uniref:ABC transporter permease n=1 Tax=Cryobacterium sp. SO2 TaxID=1897060 RepID=UPI00223E739B|nr:ABC transporter permease [Cryobacterium sp. SO2]WEO77100.1 ABC transporter permease [Cryobacterium sp. SO2]
MIPAPAAETLTPALPGAAQPVRFTGILRGEWIKLRSLRSTAWTVVIIVVVQLAFAILMALTMTEPADGTATRDAATNVAVISATLGLVAAQLAIAVQGVLLTGGEYSTGQIRSTLTAVPTRLPVLWAKAIVFFVLTFTVGFAAILIAYLAALPILSGVGIRPDAGDPTLWLRMAGGALYLALTGVIAMAIGAITRSVPGGLAATLGLILVLPSVLQLIPAEWATDLMSWLPGVAGQELFFWGNSVLASPFEPWQALLVMLGAVGVVVAGAAVQLVRRDA